MMDSMAAFNSTFPDLGVSCTVYTDDALWTEDLELTGSGKAETDLLWPLPILLATNLLKDFGKMHM